MSESVPVRHTFRLSSIAFARKCQNRGRDGPELEDSLGLRQVWGLRLGTDKAVFCRVLQPLA
jgi:hypothetical protein